MERIKQIDSFGFLGSQGGGGGGAVNQILGTNGVVATPPTGNVSIGLTQTVLNSIASIANKMGIYPTVVTLDQLNDTLLTSGLYSYTDSTVIPNITYAILHVADQVTRGGNSIGMPRFQLWVSDSTGLFEVKFRVFFANAWSSFRNLSDKNSGTTDPTGTPNKDSFYINTATGTLWTSNNATPTPAWIKIGGGFPTYAPRITQAQADDVTIAQGIYSLVDGVGDDEIILAMKDVSNGAYQIWMNLSKSNPSIKVRGVDTNTTFGSFVSLTPITYTAGNGIDITNNLISVVIPRGASLPTTTYNDGNLFILTTASTSNPSGLYQRQGNNWVLIAELGANVAVGEWLEGTGVPANNIGEVGNYYYQTDATPTPAIFIKNQRNVWEAQPNFLNTIVAIRNLQTIAQHSDVLIAPTPAPVSQTEIKAIIAQGQTIATATPSADSFIIKIPSITTITDANYIKLQEFFNPVSFPLTTWEFLNAENLERAVAFTPVTPTPIQIVTEGSDVYCKLSLTFVDYNAAQGAFSGCAGVSQVGNSLVSTIGQFDWINDIIRDELTTQRQVLINDGSVWRSILFFFLVRSSLTTDGTINITPNPETSQLELSIGNYVYTFNPFATLPDPNGAFVLFQPIVLTAQDGTNVAGLYYLTSNAQSIKQWTLIAPTQGGGGIDTNAVRFSTQLPQNVSFPVTYSRFGTGTSGNYAITVDIQLIVDYNDGSDGIILPAFQVIRTNIEDPSSIASFDTDIVNAFNAVFSADTIDPNKRIFLGSSLNGNIATWTMTLGGFISNVDLSSGTISASLTPNVYSATTQYNVNDYVQDSESNWYRCIVASLGNPLTNTTFFTPANDPTYYTLSGELPSTPTNMSGIIQGLPAIQQAIENNEVGGEIKIYIIGDIGTIPAPPQSVRINSYGVVILSTLPEGFSLSVPAIQAGKQLYECNKIRIDNDNGVKSVVFGTPYASFAWQNTGGDTDLDVTVDTTNKEVDVVPSVASGVNGLALGTKNTKKLIELKNQTVEKIVDTDILSPTTYNEFLVCRGAGKGGVDLNLFYNNLGNSLYFTDSLDGTFNDNTITANSLFVTQAQPANIYQINACFFFEQDKKLFVIASSAGSAGNFKIAVLTFNGTQFSPNATRVSDNFTLNTPSVGYFVNILGFNVETNTGSGGGYLITFSGSTQLGTSNQGLVYQFTIQETATSVTKNAEGLLFNDTGANFTVNSIFKGSVGTNAYYFAHNNFIKVWRGGAVTTIDEFNVSGQDISELHVRTVNGVDYLSMLIRGVGVVQYVVASTTAPTIKTVYSLLNGATISQDPNGTLGIYTEPSAGGSIEIIACFLGNYNNITNNIFAVDITNDDAVVINDLLVVNADATFSGDVDVTNANIVGDLPLKERQTFFSSSQTTITQGINTTIIFSSTTSGDTPQLTYTSSNGRFTNNTNKRLHCKFQLCTNVSVSGITDQIALWFWLKLNSNTNEIRPIEFDFKPSFNSGNIGTIPLSFDIILSPNEYMYASIWSSASGTQYGVPDANGFSGMLLTLITWEVQ